MLPVLTLAIGILVGAFALAFMKIKDIKVAWDTIQPFLVPLIVAGVAFYLVIANLPDFLHPPKSTSLSDLETHFLQNPANETLIMFGGFWILSGIFAYLIKIPFTNWESIKLFGFEATRVKQAANENFEAFRQFEFNKMAAIGTMTSEKGLQSVLEYVTDDLQVDSEGLVETLLHLIERVYDLPDLQAVVTSGYIASGTDTARLPKRVQEAIALSTSIKKTNERGITPVEGHWDSAIATTLLCPGNEEYVVWLYAKNYVFTETDALFVESMVSLLETNLVRALSEKFLRESAPIIIEDE
jgi:hypothetical protein